MHARAKTACTSKRNSTMCRIVVGFIVFTYKQPRLLASAKSQIVLLELRLLRQRRANLARKSTFFF
jgi:hypothetical protein